MSEYVRSIGLMPKDSNAAFAIAFGTFIAIGLLAGGLVELSSDGLSIAEIAGAFLLAVALGLLAAWQSYHLNRWLRKRGYGIGDDDE